MTKNKLKANMLELLKKIAVVLFICIGGTELLIVPDANHTDLYDNFGKIPFDKIEAFYREYLK